MVSTGHAVSGIFLCIDFTETVCFQVFNFEAIFSILRSTTYLLLFMSMQIFVAIASKWTKKLNNFYSQSSGTIGHIFCMVHYLLVLYITFIQI